MKNKIFLMVLAALLFIFTPAGLVNASEQDVPLPSEIEIVSPAPDIPSKIAAFSGRWEGVREGEEKHVFIVEEVDKENVKFIYAWGDCPQDKIRKGYIRYIVKLIVGPPVKIEFGDKVKFIFEMREDLKSIKRTRIFNGDYSVVVLKRTTPPLLVGKGI